MKDDRFLHSFYRHVHYHAIVARSNYRPEVADFVFRAYRRFAQGAPARGLEMCCGAALLSADLTRRGAEMTAVDLHPEVVRYAREHCSESVTFQAGNMLDYRIEPTVDVVTCLGNNFHVLRTNRQMVQHLKAMAECLSPGGLYICDVGREYGQPAVELLKVEPPWIVYRFKADDGPVVGEQDGIRVSVDWSGAGEIKMDPLRQLFQHDLKMTVESEQGLETIVTRETGKVYYAQEFVALVELSGTFEIKGIYSDYRLTAPCERDPTSTEIIVVLRKT